MPGFPPHGFLRERWQSPVYCTCLENRRGVKPTGGSNPSRSAGRSLTTWRPQRRSGGIGRHASLKILCRFMACGFDSRLRHSGRASMWEWTEAVNLVAFGHKRFDSVLSHSLDRSTSLSKRARIWNFRASRLASSTATDALMRRRFPWRRDPGWTAACRTPWRFFRRSWKTGCASPTQAC